MRTCNLYPLRRQFVVVAVIAYCLLGLMAAVSAQSSSSASQTPATDPEKNKLDIQKLNAEIQKLQEETTALQTSNKRLDYAVKLVATIVGAVGSVAIGFLIYFAGRSLNKTQKNKLQQDTEQGRESHLLEVFNDLGDKEPRVRVGAVAILVQRLKQLQDQKLDAVEQREMDTIVSVLISVTKHEEKDQIQKYIADGLAGALEAIAEDVEFDRQGNCLKGPTAIVSPLRKYDFQGAKLENAWWKRIDARGVDFYHAHLARAGLREAFLWGAQLKGANLQDATLSYAQLASPDEKEMADLQEANLQRARLNKANLKGVNLSKANLLRANLADADLTGAMLIQANLREADLSRAVLTKANLSEADLRGAKLDGAILDGTKFSAADVRGTDLSKAVVKDPIGYDKVERDGRTVDPPAPTP